MLVTVPRVGTKFVLREDWTVPMRYYASNSEVVCLAAGTQCTVRRVVVKKSCYTDFIKLHIHDKALKADQRHIEIDVRRFGCLPADVDLTTVRIDDPSPQPRTFLTPLLRGDTITLTDDWLFDLWFERRNSAMLDYCGNYTTRYDLKPDDKVKACVMAGSILKVDRVYIRQESDPNKPGWALNKGGEYNSITFYLETAAEEMYLIDALTSGTYALTHGKGGRKKRPRFWAKLRQVNTIVGDITHKATIEAAEI